MKTAKQTLDEALSYKNCEGVMTDGGRLEEAVIYAMKEYASQAVDRCAEVGKAGLDAGGINKQSILKVKSELK